MPLLAALISGMLNHPPPLTPNYPRPISHPSPSSKRQGSISAKASCGSDWAWELVNLQVFPIKGRVHLAFRSSIGLCAGKVEEKGKPSSRESSAGSSVRRCEESGWGPGRGRARKRVVWFWTVTELSGFNRWAEGVCQGPGQERGPPDSQWCPWLSSGAAATGSTAPGAAAVAMSAPGRSSWGPGTW